MVNDRDFDGGDFGTPLRSVPKSPEHAPPTDAHEGSDAAAPPPDPIPARKKRRSARRLAKDPAEDRRAVFTPEHRLLLLDAWRRRFEEQGPEGLMDRPKDVPRGSKLSEITKRTILMLKDSNPDWGCQRISDALARGPALGTSATTVAKVLHEAGYQFEEVTRRPHDQQPKRFERARPNSLWQTDLFTFVLKRQNRRVYLVAFMDDHSRFIVGHGLHATQSAALVIESFRAAIASYQAPEEILTDNGSQYVTWRGKSAFSKECEKRGIKQIVATPRRPQTLGKIERFWGTLWPE